MKQKFILDLASAKRIAAAAEQEADGNDWQVAIVVVDDAGHLLYLQRDTVQLGSIDVAINKAKSAALYKRPTKVWEDIVNGGRPGYMALPGLLPLEGGLPLVYKDETIGAIGISGVKSDQDGIIALAGVNAL